MRALTFAPQAALDLEEIGDFIAADNPPAARRFLVALRVRCDELVEAPFAGRTRPELFAGLRSTPFKRYVIFYTVDDDEIRIERVLHGARDIDRLFEDDDF
jgi:toxin ParE1/3/4